MNETPSVKILGEPPAGPSTLLVTWNEDGGRLGPGIAEYLSWKLAFHLFAEIEPEQFFPLSGVAIENDVAKFPSIRFYYCPDKSIVVLRTDAPTYQWQTFLSQVLDLATDLCHAKELYTVGSMMTMGTHTGPRHLLSVSNSPDMKRALTQYDVYTGMEYQGTRGQRPSMASYLIWTAGKRNLPGANLWVPVPFYLAVSKDIRAWKRALQFFNERLGMGLDISDLDSVSDRHDARIAEVVEGNPQLAEYMRKVADSNPVTQEESERFARFIAQALNDIPG